MGNRKRKYNIPKEELESLRSRRFTHRAIAKIYGCDKTIIAKRLKEYGLATRLPKIGKNKNDAKYSRRYRRKLRFIVLERLGGKCSNPHCDFSDWRALQIDHIKGGGCKELRSKSQVKYLVMLRDMPIEKLKQNYQLLCANCNWIKRYENDEINQWKGRIKNEDK